MTGEGVSASEHPPEDEEHAPAGKVLVWLRVAEAALSLYVLGDLLTHGALTRRLVWEVRRLRDQRQRAQLPPDAAAQLVAGAEAFLHREAVRKRLGG